MNICVIGYGYIGSKLVEYIRSTRKDIKITVISRNLSDRELDNADVNMFKTRYEMLSDEFYKNFTHIILLASQSGVCASKNLVNVVSNDLLNFSYLLERTDDKQIIIYASSAVSVSDQTLNYYDWSKKTLDKLVELEIKNGRRLIGLRMGTVCGVSPKMRNDLLVNKMIHDKQLYGKLKVSENDVNRAVLGLGDLCKSIVKILDTKDAKSGIYELVSFNSTVRLIANEICSGDNIIYYKNTKQVYDFTLDNTHFSKTFDFTFDDTLQNIINDLEKNTQNELVTRRCKTDSSFRMNIYCMVCNTKTEELLDLGQQPLANNYHKYNELCETYPLGLRYCSNCFHVQLNVVVSKELLFNNYLYVSGTSETGKKHFKWFAEKYPGKVLDIACNDGTQLDYYKAMGYETVGVDPASNLKEVAESKGHVIYNDFWSEELSERILNDKGTFDVIVAQNVFAHVDYPLQFLSYCKKLCNDNTKILIQTSQANMILNNEFDTAYHEHLSFFNCNSMNQLCKKVGMFLVNVWKVPIHGTSYIFEISTEDIKGNTTDVIYNEMEKGLYSVETYNRYRIQCNLYKNKFHNTLLKYKQQGYTIIGYGSTAKSNTLLNWCKIDKEIISYIIDENKLKQRLQTPGSDIMIESPEIGLLTKGKVVIVVLAWNFFVEIKRKVEKIIKNGDVKILNINPLYETNIVETTTVE